MKVKELKTLIDAAAAATPEAEVKIETPDPLAMTDQVKLFYPVKGTLTENGIFYIEAEEPK